MIADVDCREDLRSFKNFVSLADTYILMAIVYLRHQRHLLTSAILFSFA